MASNCSPVPAIVGALVGNGDGYSVINSLGDSVGGSVVAIKVL